MGVLSSQIQALITYANEKTNAGDTKLGDAVQSLIDGYGGTSTVLPFIGTNPVLIKTYTSEIRDTDTTFVAGTSAPTSMTSIYSGNTFPYITADEFPDIVNKDIVVVTDAVINITYSETPSSESYQRAVGLHGISCGYKKKTTTGVETFDYANLSSLTNEFLNSTGSVIILTNMDGISPSYNSAIYDMTASTPKFCVREPNIYAYPNSSYISSNTFLKIGSFVCKYKIKVYLVDRDTSLYGNREKINIDMMSTGQLPE